MAERRMFAKTIIDSDAFLDMSLSTQALYFHLSMRADDEGFVNNPKKIMRMIGSSDDELKILVAKKFILAFETGVIVIKHWKIHNYIRKDRIQETVYKEEKSNLIEKDNGSYSLCQSDGSQVSGKCQYRLGKVRLGEVSIGKESIDNTDTPPGKSKFIPPTVEEVESYCLERKKQVDAQRFVDFYTSKGWMVGKNKMKDWKAAVRTWEKGDDGNRTKNTETKTTYGTEI
jgi:hypothetical protein